ncbi:MAG: 5'-nucleotidase C-terminal domain-containing protein [Candidatus Eremiobacteraeota bacterium]|nr:5'-nucleotidase C-terminal domain-containing protein [Candidatus Eremiobacteraeota bacterium]
MKDSQTSHTMHHISARLLILALLVFMGASAGRARAERPVSFVILHTNDFHGSLLPLEDRRLSQQSKVGGAAFIATRVKELRKKNPGKVILLDAGDISQGTPISNIFFGQPVAKYMNYLGYDAMALGNHEFDWGMKKLDEQLSRLRFPVVCANLVQKANGRPLPRTQPYVVVTRSGMKIGIIGLVSPSTPRMCNPLNIEGLQFIPPEEPVAMYAKALRDQGVKVVGILSHLGIEVDRQLAPKLEGISFIVGGHSHTALASTEVVNNIPIVQAGYNGKYLGEFHFTVDRDTGRMLSWTTDHALNAVIDKEIIPDPSVQKLLEPYYVKVKPLMEKVVGRAEVDLLNVAPKGYGDTVLGNVVTDAVREKYGADVVLYNTEGVRAPIYKGIVTRGAIFTVLPFDNYIVTLELTGKQILDAIEFFITNPKYVQVSGMTFTYDRNKEKGERVIDPVIGGSPLVKEKKYRFATVDFLYYTTGDFEGLKEGRNFTFGGVARDVLEEYVKRHKTITAPQGNRVRIVK